MRSSSSNHSRLPSTNRWIRALNLSLWSTNADHLTCISTDCFSCWDMQHRAKHKLPVLCFTIVYWLYPVYLIKYGTEGVWVRYANSWILIYSAEQIWPICLFDISEAAQNCDVEMLLKTCILPLLSKFTFFFFFKNCWRTTIQETLYFIAIFHIDL